jgi:hypothetical protein
VSSAILYGAIVVIWAGVLIPRWLRREMSSEEASVISESPMVASPDAGSAPGTASPSVASPAGAGLAGAGSPADVAAPREERPARTRDSEHARVIGARRRLLGMLVALAIGAGVLAVTKLAAWWVVLPPSVMLVGYLALLREASRADSERRRVASKAPRRAEPTRSQETVQVSAQAPVQAAFVNASAQAPASASASGSVFASAPASVSARPSATPVPPSAAPDAEVIDITARVSDELYDQVADAKLRAVGD